LRLWRNLQFAIREHINIVVVPAQVESIIKITHFRKNRPRPIPEVEVPMETNIKAMVGRKTLSIDRSEKGTEINIKTNLSTG
jgi:hypothetical protein